MTLTSPEASEDASTVNALLAMGPYLGTFLSTVTSAERAIAVHVLDEAIGLPEEVYTELLFRPTNVIMVELPSGRPPRTFIGGPDGVYVDDRTIFSL